MRGYDEGIRVREMNGKILTSRLCPSQFSEHYSGQKGKGVERIEDLGPTILFNFRL